jgi:uncharacterized protein YvpB
VGALPSTRLVGAAVVCIVITALGLTPLPVRAAWSAYINSRPVQQQHALDCEAAALQIALSAVGISTSQDSLLSSMGQDARPPVMGNGHPVQWGNPYTSFVGDWNGSMLRTGYGVYYPPVVTAARAAGATATGAEGWQPSQLYSAVASGDPVLVWLPHLLAAPSFGAWTAWDGASIWYSPQEHTQVLVGFDYGHSSVTLADPWDGRLHTYAMSLFESRLQAFHSMAIVVRPSDGPSAAATSSNGHQVIFWKGTDSNLWEAWNNGTGWTGDVEVTAAAPLASAPSVALTALGQQIVFWKGTDGILHEIWWDPRSGWNGPVPVNSGTNIASRPSVMVTDGNQVLFWESLGGGLEEMWWNASSGWNGPVGIPRVAGVSSAPSAIAVAAGSRTDQAVFWKGADGTLTESWWDPVSGWNGPVQVPGPLPMGSGPSALVTPSNRQVVYWEGSNQTLRGAQWFGSWSGEVTYSFATLSSTPSVDITGAGTQVLFYKGTDGNAWTSQQGNSWSSPTNLHLGPIA